MRILFQTLRHTSLYWLTSLLLLLSLPALANETAAQDILEDSIVKIYVTSKSQNSYSPWNADSLTSSVTVQTHYFL